MLVRQCWKDLLAIILTKRHVILKGKAGRGKSLFVLWAIFEILLCAKRGEPSIVCPTANFPRDPRIVFVDRLNVKYLVSASGICILSGDGWPPNVHYCFSDNQDIGDAWVGSLLTMAVTSGDVTVLREFSKRMEAIDEDIKSTVFMPSLDLEEMKLLFPNHNAEQLEFKFLIVGGNPQKIRFKEEVNAHSNYYSIVSETLEWMFGKQYVHPLSVEKMSAKQRQGKWALGVVVSALEKHDSSLFKEIVVEKQYRGHYEQYASVFLGLVAAKLQQQLSEDLPRHLEMAMIGAIRLSLLHMCR